MKTITVNEHYQKGYQYSLLAPAGKQFDPEFKPQLTPSEMIKLGVFGGCYFTVPPKEFPSEWFKGARFSKSGKPDGSLNYFKLNASQSLDTWQKNGWIYFEDPLGWFLWYCRYYMGRRIPEEDSRQIKRWINNKRHIAQLQKNCVKSDITCRPKQRQALLHWAYDSRVL